jgi:hypothetical protein
MYLEFFLLKKLSRVARFLRGTNVDDAEESESTDWATDRFELDGLHWTPVGEASRRDSGNSTASDIRASFGGVRIAGKRSLIRIWSLDVREGAEVKLVDCVSCECTDMELLGSLSTVTVESALEMSCGAHRNFHGSWMPLSVARRASSSSTASSFWFTGRRRASEQ